MKVLIVCGGAGKELLKSYRELGFAAVLHVDMAHEVDRSVPFLALDAGTTGYLFLKTSAEFLASSFPANLTLARGAKGHPAVAGLAVRLLEAQMFGAFEVVFAGMGKEERAEVWIVSSATGGTGSGTRRPVGEALARYFSERWPDSVLQLNLLTVLPSHLTFQQRLNAFFGVSADAAFPAKLKVFPAAVPFFFYTALSDFKLLWNLLEILLDEEVQACRSLPGLFDFPGVLLKVEDEPWWPGTSPVVANIFAQGAFQAIYPYTRVGDAVSFPALLMKPFAPAVKKALEDWEEEGKLKIALAVTPKECLSFQAMLRAGLSEEDLKKLEEFYQPVLPVS